MKADFFCNRALSVQQ